MVDIHHHLLPGLDDGSPDLATSVAMARMAADDGITHVIATPHASNNYTFEPARTAAALAALREAIAKESIPLHVASGCDFHLSYDNVQDAIAHPTRYTLNQTEYLLIELPDHSLSPNLVDTFYQLRIAGMVPILTHPERNPTLQQNPARIADWLRDGMLIQVTANSVTGDMGSKAQRMALELLRNRWVHFLATDAHNLTARPPILSEARKLVARRFSESYADLLCTANPQALLEGRILPEQEEPLHLYDDEEFIGLPWWKRLLKIRG